MIESFLAKTAKYHRRSNQSKLGFLESEIVGRTATWDGPYGERRILFCDHATSSRALRFVEKFIFGRIFPYYVHEETECTATGRYTSSSVANARHEVRHFANADDSYAVLFVGNGSTSAINRLFHIVDLAARDDLAVVLGPFETDSTILAAKMSCKDVIRVKINSEGAVDRDHLRSVLEDFSRRGKRPLGVFSIVSNVSGIVTFPDYVTKILHEYNGISCWDYTAAAPYLCMNVTAKEAVYSKDAVFFSPHNFVGGVSTPGVLIAKQDLFVNSIPGDIGGGSAAYVTHKTHALKRVIEEREEGGTPNVVGKIRTGLLFQLTKFISHNEVEEVSYHLSEELKAALVQIPNLTILGSVHLKMMPIVSFIIKYSSQLRLHHHYVTALLNDLFGIQSRSGTMNVGPYSQTLLGLEEDAEEDLLSYLDSDGEKNGHSVEEIMSPGYSRLSLMYSIKEKDVDFIISALEFVAQNGWKFLPAYKFDAKTGYWSYDRATLQNHWDQARICSRNKPFLTSRQTKCIKFAQDLASGINAHTYHEERVQNEKQMSQEAFEKKWFLLPNEALRDLKA